LTDVHDKVARSRNMAAIRSRHTRPELAVRKALHSLGLRYRLHVSKLPGNPDLVFPKHQAVLFVNGCFWHRHDCYLFKWPATREEFWKNKIARNVLNDKRAVEELLNMGWRVGVIWECALKGRVKLDKTGAIKKIAQWVNSCEKTLEIRGVN
jgi:DNA mismatch endonuclease, patch repair protein